MGDEYKNSFTPEELIERVEEWMLGWVESECMYDDEADRNRNHEALAVIKDLILEHF